MSAHTAHLLIGLLNALGALGSGLFGVVGSVRPALALGPDEPVHTGVVFYAWAYAVRAVPLSVVVLVLLAGGAWDALAPALVVAGLAQLGDAALGAARRNPGMLGSSATLAAVHLGSAGWLLTR
ncbi:hypothetical protein [Streptomyces sp. NPDC051636]|uniref:hypothetical protein n=1 Tax=Streptomyces sp. NPDC051636 TaxID=3365663 RepID=UPI0037AB1F58